MSVAGNPPTAVPEALPRVPRPPRAADQVMADPAMMWLAATALDREIAALLERARGVPKVGQDLQALMAVRAALASRIDEGEAREADSAALAAVDHRRAMAALGFKASAILHSSRFGGVDGARLEPWTWLQLTVRELKDSWPGARTRSRAPRPAGRTAGKGSVGRGQRFGARRAA